MMTDEYLDESGKKLEFVSFQIGQQEFCIEITSVREIRGWAPETSLPHVPSYVRGVINLRGTVLPIVDLADRFGLDATEPNERNVIIVVQIKEKLVGLLVDAVSDIIVVPQDEIQPIPEVNGELQLQFAQGLFAVRSRMLCIIDLTHVVPELERGAA